MTYPVLGLIVLSLVFVAGTSSSQNIWYQTEVKGYSAPVGPEWMAFRASDMLGAQLTTFDNLYLAQICGLGVNVSAGVVDTVGLCDVKGLGGERLFVPFDRISKTGNTIYIYNSEPDNIYQFKGATPYGKSEGFAPGYVREEEYVEHTAKVEEPMMKSEVRGAVDVCAPKVGQTDVKVEHKEAYVAPMGNFDASMFIGTAAYTSTGENLGRIDDFVIDPSGHIIYVVLSDFGGTEGRFVAVPFRTASLSSGNTLVFTTTREVLIAAPAFDWRDISSRKYASDVYIYFGVQPYWQ
jgi:hypothetical protein